MKQQTRLILFTTQDGKTTLDVPLENETVWLNRNQLALLFDRDVKTIGKHINNALAEELSTLSNSTDNSVVAKFATTAADGKKYQTEHYSMDIILSVGYRVKSTHGIEFRRWANKVLKEYIFNGIAVNEKRLSTLGKVVEILKRTGNTLEAKQILSVIEQYTYALDMLDDYDHQKIEKPDGSISKYQLQYEECIELINSMRFTCESDLFGRQKDESFQGSLGAIYQTFGGKDLYPTVQEKAANVLYLVVKNHSFHDGNKRIAAALFLYFLDKTGFLFKDGVKIIPDTTLVAITIMIAESKPQEKELMINLVMHFLTNQTETR
ncbi:MAG TPA: phosphoribosylaminoimidazolesuccinocarboxamide synthase [Treponema sp.]|nr:phosphoribosylaminoimidazolesuccinocarboxamide synthase [Treponema sp.]